ncbi:DEAD/DEAH box helicase [Planoprotostelium fungivorum]|uniref:RNA helicase n=1 Tax=Planoprotostelium fungivorum TaxID=1890364 RepID=A0A2P6NW50_9EUKA|nr:DEAD/DEAH box helicase [Planoprotostelium fungivorum]
MTGGKKESLPKGGKGKKEEIPAPAATGKGKNQGKKEEAPATTNNTKGKGKNKEEETVTPVEKPKQTWTGKSPATQLYEWCQRNKYDKPVFNQYRSGKQGFKWQVVMTQKTNSQTFIPDFFMPESVAARHAAAIVALHNFCHNLSMHTVLPPEFRDLWHELGVKRKEREEEEKVKEKIKVQKKEEMEAKQKKNDNLSQIYMGTNSRKIVEDAIKTMRGQKEEKMQEGPVADRHIVSASELSKSELGILSHLRGLGFASGDCFRSLSENSSIGECLDWLCMNVPEERLPKLFGPSKGNIEFRNFAKKKVVNEQEKLMAELDETNLRVLNRLEDFGFPYNHIVGFLKDYPKGKSEEETFQDTLQEIWRTCVTEEGKKEAKEVDESVEEMIENEMMALESILGEEYKLISHRTIQIEAHPQMKDTTSRLEIYFLNSRYPHEVPPILYHNESLTSEIRFHICKKIAQQCQTMLGEPYLYSLLLWLPSIDIKEIESIIAAEKEASEKEVSAKVSELDVKEPTETGQAKKTKQRAPQRNQHKSKLTEEQKKKLSADLYQERKRLEGEETFQKMQKLRSKLPANQYAEDILSSLKENQIIVISGSTGCGKSTQIPQIILDDYVMKNRGGEVNMICTQPRRISAIGLAQRVSAERGDALGESVGYSVRLESKMSWRTRLQYCTVGILLRRMGSDPLLDGVTHLIVDEVHERSLDIDFVLILIRGLIAKRPELKIILMSASLNAQLFANYFGSKTPILSIPGKVNRTVIRRLTAQVFPVKEYHLEDVIEFTKYSQTIQNRNDRKEGEEKFVESLPDKYRKEIEHKYTEDTIDTLNRIDREKIDYDIMERLVLWIVDGLKEGAVLIFLPGMIEILTITERLKRVRGRKEMVVLPLHSSLTTEEQTRVFDRYPGKIKIIASTNIAETSVTIEDIVAVVDCGRANQTVYDPLNKLPSLKMSWISQASMTQRKGRAGRVRAGECYRLFTKYDAEKAIEHDTPEIARVPLQQLLLSIKHMRVEGGSTLKHFLSRAIEPPSAEAIDSAVEILSTFGAFEKGTEKLTALGYHLASLPADIHLSKMMIFSSILRCVDPILTICATMSTRSPFVSPMDKRKEASEAHKKFQVAESDHLSFLSAYNQWWSARAKGDDRNFCTENFLSRQVLLQITDLKYQLAEQLSEIGFLPEVRMSKGEVQRYKNLGSDGIAEITGTHYNVNSKSNAIIKAVLCSGMYPNVISIQKPEAKYIQTGSGAVPLLSEAVEFKFRLSTKERVFIHPRSVNFSVREFQNPYMIFHQKMQTSKVFVSDSSTISHYPLLLFGGDIQVFHKDEQIVIDKWIRFLAPARIAVLVKEIRLELDKLLSEKITNPQFDVSSSALVGTVSKLLITEGL